MMLGTIRFAIGFFTKPVIAYANYPRSGIVATAEDGTNYDFNIISPEAASCLGVMIGSDTNVDIHIGPEGSTQSNAIIGICATAVVQAIPGRLTLVEPLTFKEELPLGQTCHVRIDGIRSKLGLTFCWIELRHEGKPIMKRAKLRMA